MFQLAFVIFVTVVTVVIVVTFVVFAIIAATLRRGITGLVRAVGPMLSAGRRCAGRTHRSGEGRSHHCGNFA